MIYGLLAAPFAAFLEGGDHPCSSRNWGFYRSHGSEDQNDQKSLFISYTKAAGCYPLWGAVSGGSWPISSRPKEPHEEDSHQAGGEVSLKTLSREIKT